MGDSPRKTSINVY